MTARISDFDPPRIPFMISTNQLRDNLSEHINRAAFGKEPVLVMRRGRKIAALVSIPDLAFLERMKQRREEAMTESLPPDEESIGPAMARHLYWEIFFGSLT
jgi:prevent-host-death family protein